MCVLHEGRPLAEVVVLQYPHREDRKNVHNGLCSAMVYGPNASGKTNIIGAMEIFKQIVLCGNIRNVETKDSPNAASNALELIANNTLNSAEPVSFSITSIEEGLLFEYAISLDLGRFLEKDHERKVLKETLCVNDITLFTRGENLQIGDLKVIEPYLVPAYEQNAKGAAALAQYWKDYPKRLIEIEHQAGLSLEHPHIYFEYATESLGDSNASMSDVMIVADGVRVAIEAKFTEFAKYGFETIGKWLSLSNDNRDNKIRVLEHWVNKITPYSEGNLTNIEDLPYQFLHRLACVCDKNPGHAVLLYQLFIDDETRPTLDEMLNVFSAARERINPKSNLKILFQQIECRQVRHYNRDELKYIFSNMKSDRGSAYYFPDD